ncbi:MAG: DEAD/DEAH box helicase family protein [Spirochaetota bacterium]
MDSSGLSAYQQTLSNLLAMIHKASRVRDAEGQAEALSEILAAVRSARDGEELPIGTNEAGGFGAELVVNNDSPGIVTTRDHPPLAALLDHHIRESEEVFIASAFLSAADTNPLVLALQEITDSGKPVRVLTSLMGFINLPDALEEFARWGSPLEFRIFAEDPADERGVLNERPAAFHAKAVLCKKKNAPNVLAVGSANFTGAGLRSNIEWNYISDFEVNAPVGARISPFDRAVALFEDTLQKHGFTPTEEFLARYRELHERTRALRAQLRGELRHAVRQDVHRERGEQSPKGDVSAGVPSLPEKARVTPREAQLEALDALAHLREQGARKFAVIAATGIGKTYLSAFEVAAANAERVLFVAHRESILRQAAKAYGDVLPGRKAVFLRGKESLADLPEGPVVAFAMIQTIGREENLASLDLGSFDYVIIDEFHHAEAPSYRLVLDRLAPRYLLGMTATPERTDGQDVLRFCDRRVAYEVRLPEAIEREWLVPFHYYALYDEIELEASLSQDTRADLIVRNLRRFQPESDKRKCLAFCSNVGHARWMATAFAQRGIPAACLVGETPEDERQDLLARLQNENDELQVVCAVDVLNEGIDVPSLTHILLLRPTTSFTVFTQQLGRGLRIAPGKTFVVVLDFVGNYNNSYVAPLVLQGHHSLTGDLNAGSVPEFFKAPAGCIVSIETDVRRVWREQLYALSRPKNRLERIRRVIEELSGEDAAREIRLPDLFTTEDAAAHAKAIREEGGWLGCRLKLDLATDYERSLAGTRGADFLLHIEQELQPVKSYKMAVLHSLFALDQKSGAPQTSWQVESIAREFHSYYLEDRSRLADWDALAAEEDPAAFPLSKVISHISKMPLHFLSNADRKFFVLDGEEFRLKDDVHKYWKDDRFRALVAERIEYAEARYWYSR